MDRNGKEIVTDSNKLDSTKDTGWTINCVSCFTTILSEQGKRQKEGVVSLPNHGVSLNNNKKDYFNNKTICVLFLSIEICHN